MTELDTRYELERDIWDGCARIYEKHIVRGHPDVIAYEEFEHTFLDNLITHLGRDCGSPIHLYDFGCGSGRLHQIFGARMAHEKGINFYLKASSGLQHIGGVDFSKVMIELAKEKIRESGLGGLMPGHLSFDVGSAFDVAAYDGEALPLAVSVCNSLGVMQGEEGARKLFSAMRRYVEEKKGLAIISCYRQEAFGSFALGNYESTLEVSGQPLWLEPDTYAGNGYKLKPKHYKRAYDKSTSISVDVYNENGKRLQSGMLLHRNPETVAKAVKKGELSTHASYTSRWYSSERIKDWMTEVWGDATCYHIEGKNIDAFRGAPAQLAVLDFSGKFGPFAKRLGLEIFRPERSK